MSSSPTSTTDLSVSDTMTTLHVQLKLNGQVDGMASVSDITAVEQKDSQDNQQPKAVKRVILSREEDEARKPFILAYYKQRKKVRKARMLQNQKLRKQANQHQEATSNQAAVNQEEKAKIQAEQTADEKKVEQTSVTTDTAHPAKSCHSPSVKHASHIYSAKPWSWERVRELLDNTEADVNQHIQAIFEDYQNYSTQVKLCVQHKVALQWTTVQRARVFAAALMYTADKKRFAHFLIKASNVMGVSELLRTCELLDSRRAYEQCERLKNHYHQLAQPDHANAASLTAAQRGRYEKKWKQYQNRMNNINERTQYASLSGARIRFLRTFFIHLIKKETLEFYLLNFPTQTWKSINDYLHLKAEDFSLDYFQKVIYGEQAPVGSVVHLANACDAYTLSYVLKENPSLCACFSFLRNKFKDARTKKAAELERCQPLMAMGFSLDLARVALRRYPNTQMAAEWLMDNLNQALSDVERETQERDNLARLRAERLKAHADVGYNPEKTLKKLNSKLYASSAKDDAKQEPSAPREENAGAHRGRGRGGRGRGRGRFAATQARVAAAAYSSSSSSSASLSSSEREAKSYIEDQLADHDFTSESRHLLAKHAPLTDLLWFYEELESPEVEKAIYDRLKKGEELDENSVRASYGKLMERLLLFMERGTSFAPLLLQYAERKLEQLKRNIVLVSAPNAKTHASTSSSSSSLTNTPIGIYPKAKSAELKCAVLGDASGSMEVAIKCSCTLGSLLSAVLKADLSFFHELSFKPSVQPRSAEQAIKIVRETKAQGATSMAAALYPFYESKTKVDLFILVSDEGENRTFNGLSFVQLFTKYREEINPEAKLFYVSFLQQNEEGKLFSAMKDARSEAEIDEARRLSEQAAAVAAAAPVPGGVDPNQQVLLPVKPVQYRLDGLRPDTSKFDALLGSVLLEAQAIQRKKEDVSNVVRQLVHEDGRPGAELPEVLVNEILQY